MRKYIIVNSEKRYNINILKKYIDVFGINDNTFYDLIICPKEDKQEVFNGKIFLPEMNLRGLYRYFNVKNYDELYNKLENRINIKQRVDNENKITVDGYIFDVKDYSFIYLYYKYLSQKEKEKLSKKLGTNVDALTKDIIKISNGKINKNIFIELLKEYNQKSLSNLREKLEKITSSNKQKRIIEKFIEKDDMEENNMKQKTYNRMLELATKKYHRYDIDITILEKLLNSLRDREYEDEIQITFDFNLLIENYIIEEIKKENIDYQIILIDENRALKSMILKKQNNNIDFNLNKLYEDAIEEMIYNYDPSIPISKNILIQFKKVIENYKNKQEKMKQNCNLKEQTIEQEEDMQESKKEEVEVKSTEEYKENEENNKENELIILLTNKYINETRVSKINFSKQIQVNRVQLINYLNKKQNSKKVPLAIMKYFEAKSINELEEKVNLKINQYYENLKTDDTNNIIINLANKYIAKTKMTKAAFAKEIKVSRIPLTCYLNNTKNSKTIPLAILKYFDAKTLDELEEKVNLKLQKYFSEHKIDSKEKYDNIEVHNETIVDKAMQENIAKEILENEVNKMDKKQKVSEEENNKIILLVNNYVSYMKISKKEFAQRLGIHRVTLINHLNKKQKSKIVLEAIMKYFDAKTIDELEEKIILETDKINIKSKKTEEVQTELISKETQNIDVINKNDILKLVNIDVLNNLLDELLQNNSISKEEYIISWFLFGRNKGIYYSKEKISEFLNVSIEYINDVYITSLKVYKNYFDNLLENVAKLELSNNDLN